MLQRLFDDFRTRAGHAAHLAALAVAGAVALFVTCGFLSAAAFMFVLPREGPVAACLSGGAVFLFATLLTAASYAAKKQQDKRRLELAAKEAAQSAKSLASTLFSEPASVAIGLELARHIGARRIVPLLAIGGIALGFWASQRVRADASPAE